MNMPTKIDITVNTIYGESFDATIIPMTLKATTEIQNAGEEIKSDNMKKATDKIKELEATLRMQTTDEAELREQYSKLKIQSDMIMSSETKITEKKINSIYAKTGDKTIGKSFDEVLNLTSKLVLDNEIRSKILNYTTDMTLYHIIRKRDNLRERLFESVDDLQESLDENERIRLLDSMAKDPSDDDLKN